MEEIISLRRFNEIDLNDPFLDSLKTDYPGFEEWFIKKAKAMLKHMFNTTMADYKHFYIWKTRVGQRWKTLALKGLHAVD